MPRTPQPVLDALRLRGWALRTLCSPAPPAAPPGAGADAWSGFLLVEQCALALSARAAGVLDGEAERVVAAFARAESRTVLSARAQLRRLGAMAAAEGLRLVVLKGGVPLLRGGGGPRLLDLDVLASAPDAAALAAALERTGYAPHGAAAAHRLAVRAAAGEIPVEIHTAVPGLSPAVWGRVAPAHGGGPLLVLHPADHLHYLLLHSAVQHADRRGRIRDLLLLAEALEHASATDVAETRAAVAAEPEAAVLEEQLALALALARREPRADAFELTAAGTYLLHRTLERRGTRGLARELVWQAGVAAVARRAGTPSSLGGHSLDLPSAFPPLARLRRAAPWAERAARLLVRRGREWAFLPFGLSIAAAAERAVRERASPP